MPGGLPQLMRKSFEFGVAKMAKICRAEKKQEVHGEVRVVQWERSRNLLRISLKFSGKYRSAHAYKETAQG